MDLYELAGVNVGTPHNEAYDRIIDALGGLEAIAPYMPFGVRTLTEAYAVDRNLNNLPMSAWDEAAGYSDSKLPRSSRTWMPTGGGIWPLLRSKGVNESTASQNVCLLKRAAERIALGEDPSAPNHNTEARHGT